MNSYKFNSHASSFLIFVISNFFKMSLIEKQDIYKKVKNYDVNNSIITVDNGKKYLVTLKEIE